jgi:hypothetical protein
MHTLSFKTNLLGLAFHKKKKRKPKQRNSFDLDFVFNTLNSKMDERLKKY